MHILYNYFLIYDVFYMFRTLMVHLQEDGCTYRFYIHHYKPFSYATLLIVRQLKHTVPYLYVKPYC